MAAPDYHPPSALELAFLRTVTRGYPELQKQIESCEVADYEPTGWCSVYSAGGPPSNTVNPAQGPSLNTGEPDNLNLEALLWTNEAGMLKAVEIVDYGIPGAPSHPYELFVDAARRGCLEYETQGQ